MKRKGSFFKKNFIFFILGFFYFVLICSDKYSFPLPIVVMIILTMCGVMFYISLDLKNNRKSKFAQKDENKKQGFVVLIFACYLVFFNVVGDDKHQMKHIIYLILCSLLVGGFYFLKKKIKSNK